MIDTTDQFQCTKCKQLFKSHDLIYLPKKGYTLRGHSEVIDFRARCNGSLQSIEDSSFVLVIPAEKP